MNNVAFVIEGAKNLAKGNWLTGALVGGTIGYKDLGSYIVHSTQITGFVQENFTKTEQKSFWDAGLNYLSKPTQGYFHIVNGLNSFKAISLATKPPPQIIVTIISPIIPNIFFICLPF